MSQKRGNRGSAAWSREQETSNFKAYRRGLRDPAIETDPWQSPLEALAKGLVSIGEKLKFRPPLRVI